MLTLRWNDLEYLNLCGYLILFLPLPFVAAAGPVNSVCVI